ncbi:hypothetical protein F4813DRAFT_384889 [Daldinia decipiens]|uniref:uncharacterized protein n=1 Tax=Daldinia decipiens TaxID=326647 RepID=UPI0020C1F5A5|nr:uncharacterized protein F4813DRAFT_384889 [Daldinia decipiens]KAI1662177.1 hypothetical protein F4813DRAFT_384889 [Daldinia decipiens]
MSEPDSNRPEKPAINEKATSGVQNPLNPLECLPSELRHCILASLSDVTSLISAASSCRILYATFKESESIIIWNVLINSLGSSVLPIATITYRCSPPFCSESPECQIGSLRDEMVKSLKTYASEFMGNLEPSTPSPTEFSMRDAIALDAYHHQVVLKLTQNLIQAYSRTSSSYLDIGHSLQALSPSSSEKERIARSLYQFEIFRRLFGCLRRWAHRAQDLNMVFFSKFAPWENAQLACIHDFLARQLIPVFNEIARHDVVWGGEYLVNFDANIDDNTIQHLLTLGLERIILITSAESYRDREALLKIEEMPPEENSAFLSYCFDEINKLNPHEGYGAAILKAPAFFLDEDSGAEQIWKTSLECDISRHFAIYDELDWPYRECGYVFWDQGRLRALGALKSAWKPAERSAYNSVVDMKEMESSWEERASIYNRGGRGFWSKDDDMQVVWPVRQKEQTPHVVLESLAEAKDFWRTTLRLNNKQ